MFPERSAGPILARMMDPPSPAPNAGLLFGAPPSVGCPAVTQRRPAGANFFASSSQLFRGRYDCWHMRNRFDILPVPSGPVMVLRS